MDLPDGMPVPRMHHLIFAHKMLPSLFFDDPAAMISASNAGGHNDGRFAELWQVCANDFVDDKSEHISPDGLTVHPVEFPPVVGAVWVLPKPKTPPECYMVFMVAVLGKSLFGKTKLKRPHYFTAEKYLNPENKPDAPKALIARWDKRENHKELGVGMHDVKIQHFVGVCLDHMGIAWDGKTLSIRNPQPG